MSVNEQMRHMAHAYNYLTQEVLQACRLGVQRDPYVEALINEATVAVTKAANAALESVGKAESKAEVINNG